MKEIVMILNCDKCTKRQICKEYVEGRSDICKHYSVSQFLMQKQLKVDKKIDTGYVFDFEETNSFLEILRVLLSDRIISALKDSYHYFPKEEDNECGASIDDMFTFMVEQFKDIDEYKELIDWSPK